MHTGLYVNNIDTVSTLSFVNADVVIFFGIYTLFKVRQPCNKNSNEIRKHYRDSNHMVKVWNKTFT